METGRRKQNARITRWLSPHIVPLEVWDLVIGDDILWDYRDSEDFPEVLAAALSEIRDGTARTRSGGALPLAARGFDAVYLTGGNARPEMQASFNGLTFAVFISGDGVFCGERAGQLLMHANGRNGIVVDVGQTAIKISCGNQRFSYARDWAQLPLRDDPWDEVRGELPLRRRNLREFIASSIRAAIEAVGESPQMMVVALPCELNDRGTPGGSSYPGMLGDATLINDSLTAAGVGNIEVLLFNDAELAALSAWYNPAFDLPARTLVITLGFGVGAALLMKDAHD